MRRLPIALLCLGLSTPIFAQTTPDINAYTRLLLDAYAKGDRPYLKAHIDPTFNGYGSDLAEVVHGPAAFDHMLEQDLQLWGGSAHIGAMRDVSLVQQKDFASIFFNADFSLPNQKPIPLRFAMVWHRVHGSWLLVQSSNVVPTQGQSAAELLVKH
jgi:hypothetical protein